MRLLLPSTTIIAALGGAACHQVAKESTNNAIVKTKFASDVEAAYKSDPLGQRQQSRQHKRSLERERAEKINVTKETQLPDVGILRSGDGGDTTKSNRVFYPLFRHGQKKMSREEVQRFLQEEEVVVNTCPVGCPQEFCDCGAEFGEVKYCTKEMLSVCDRGIVSRCVKEEDIEFYEKTYCAFSECVESGQPYENCACGYYEAYCQLFYDYEESFESCVTAECCENTPADDRATCIPAMQPTTNPTASPTATVPPTVSPTGTAAPTISSKPTISSEPSSSPSQSSQPTTSPKPTPLASASPSAQPTVSAKPTPFPTMDPTSSPSNSPTNSPTVSPSDMPSISPSKTPSASPSISAAPTISTSPSASPTTTSSPSISSQPSASPSISTAPTSSPSGSPTVSAAPTSSPSTTSPTLKPTVEPTKKPTVPTKAPTDVPTYMPTITPTEESAIVAPSGGIAPSLNILIPCVGAALWLFGL